jgi:hypothetical protein
VIFVSSAVTGEATVFEIDGGAWERDGRPSVHAALSSGALAVALRGLLAPETCGAWVRSVYARRSEWTEDFGGEQFALGRAFYTHVESGRSAEYFADASASDARVERAVPGMAQWMRALYGALVGGVAVQRRGFCGPAVHVFPAGEKVAREGGVVHFDVEGLTRHHVERRMPAVTLVVMLQPAQSGGGLMLWDQRYPEDDPGDDEPVTVLYAPGDVVVMDSYRLHQIAPFDGDADRVSITLHGMQTDRGRWECWF